MNILRFVVPKSLVEYITIDSTVRQALEKMAYHRYTAISVLDDEGHYMGMVRTEEILKFFIENKTFDKTDADDVPITTILKTNYPSPISHNTTMQELIESAKEHNFVPIVDDRNCFIGIILRRDILNFLLKFYNENEDD